LQAAEEREKLGGAPPTARLKNSPSKEHGLPISSQPIKGPLRTSLDDLLKVYNNYTWVMGEASGVLQV
jgi:hypothetical protein